MRIESYGSSFIESNLLSCDGLNLEYQALGSLEMVFAYPYYQ